MWKSWLIGDYDNKRFGKGIVRRLAVVLGSAALLLPLAEPVGRRTGAVARYLLAMAATAMAIPAQAQTTCAEPNFGTRRQIWTGTLTVAEGRGGSLSFGHGYSTFLDNTGGDLSNKNFDIGVNSYVITQAFLFVSTNREQDNVITFSLASNLTAAEVAALRLHVCDTAYDFSEANQSSAQFSHTWVLFLDWSSESTRTLYLSLPANNAATGLPTISGTAEFGEALTAATSNIADTDGLPTSFQYQWLRENQDGTGQEPIGGATSNTYTLAFEDVGKKVKVRVNFTDMLNGMEEVTSAAYPATGTVSGLGVVSVDAASVSADEGETLTYTMTLRNQPTGNVTITPESDNSGAVSVSPASLTFTTSNWNTARTVSVTAEQDADGADETVTISHSVTGYGAVTVADAVTVTVDDDDVPGVSVTPPASSSLSEGSGTAITYTMKLDTEPTGNVTIAPDSGVDSNAVSVSPARLIFTTSNWNTARTVSVTAMEDFDATDEMVSISHAVSGADYASVTADSVNVIVTDNDTRSVTVSGSPLTINEGGTGTYSVVLTSQPTDAVTVMPSRSGDPDVTVSDALTFSTSNWDTPQTVTVSAAEDNDADNDTATIAHAVSGADYASITAASIDVTVTDNDTRGITLSEPTLSLSLNEGSGVTYTVMLNIQPTGEVTVTPSRSSGDTDVTVSAALTFSTSNWDTPQTVTVSAAEDNDASNDTATITHNVSGADYDTITAASMQVTVNDNDTRGITLSEPALRLSLNEGSGVTYTVVLNTQPTGEVTVTPSRSSGDTDVTVSDALTFSTTNWDTPQTVTVSAAEDSDASNDTATIAHAVSGADYDTLTADPVQVTVNDNEAVDDTAPMVISITRQAPIASPTNGDSLTWRVTFSEVVENVDATDFTVSGSTATVTNVEPVGGEPHAYDVTVSGGDLAGLDGTVTLGFASGQDIGDAAGHALAITPPTGSSNNSYLVDNTAPMLTYTPPTVLTVGTAITVIAPTTTDDDIARTSATGLPAGLTITTTGAISGTPTTASPATSVVVVTVTDNAGNQTEVRLAFPAVREAVQPGVSVAPTTSLSLNEGETSAYTLVLETPPPGNVTITPTSGDSGAVSMSPASLTFTPSNWDTPRTVTVTGVNDDDATETVTIRHSVSGYGAVSVGAVVTVTVNDDDTTQGEAEASEAAKEVADAVLEEVVLPDVMQQLTARTTELITSRLTTTASGSPGDPLTISLDDVLTDTVAVLHGQREHLKNGSLTWRQALSGRSFAFPLSGLNLARGGSAGGQEHPFSSLVVWGGADYSSYGNTIEHTDVDGNGFSGVIGMDLQPSPQLTTGLAITTSRWGLDYATNTNATTTNDATAEGTYEIGVTMLHPYVNWWATEHLSLWATFGYGRGEVEQDPEEGNATTRTDALTSWAGGVRFEVVPAMDPLTGQGSPFGLAFKADGATSSFLETQVQLARLAAEVSRSFAVENGLLTTALELGWRLHSVSDKDGLDGLQQRIADKQDSGGAELAGRLNWRDSEGRLSATVDTRVVLGGGHHREWGMGGYLRFTPSRRAGEGLSLTLQPSFGVTDTRLDELWSLSGDGDLAINNDPPGARLDARLAYGFRHGDGLLTPYTEVAWEEGGSIYGAGLRYGLNRSLELDLKGARHRHTDGNPENRLLLEVHSRL